VIDNDRASLLAGLFAMRAASNFPTLPLALAAVVALATAGAWLVLSLPPPISASGPVFVGKTITTGTASIGGPFTLVSTNGDTVTDRVYRGKWLLIFFGYTFCPDACPTALYNISVALEKLGPDASKLQPLFITADPQRDTHEVMAEYLKAFDPRIIGLTGTQAQIDSVAKEYRVYVAQETAEREGDYLVSHSAYTYLIDPQGKFVNVIAGSAAGEEIAAWLRKEMGQPGGNGNPLKATSTRPKQSE
jgi:protein SCO1/2